jgi:DnaD/phage-associated family protein
MARPKSDTVDYFTHDSDASIRRTLMLIEARFGVAGYTFWYKLLEWLGGSAEGHYFDAREPSDLELLARVCGSDVTTGTAILQKLADLGAIDPILWMHRVIWSQKFVDRLEDVYRKRRREVPSKPCFYDENCKHPRVKLEISGEKTGVFVPKMPQSKLNKRKLNNTKENKTTEKKITPVVISSTGREEDYVYEVFEQHIGELTPSVREEIKAKLGEFPATWVADACKEAGNKPQDRSWPYAAGILENWKRAGRNAESGPSPGGADKYHKGKFSHLVRG